ncbi:MAG: ABC transporter permease [Bacteroidota bacterium]
MSSAGHAVSVTRRFREKVRRDFRINKALYLMALPVIVYYVVFHYKPMYGAIIAFKDYSPLLGIEKSPWIGLRHFKDFFNGFYFWRILRNTVVISLNSLFFGFPTPIIFALLLNELRNQRFKRVVQTITYMPHFISLVVICGMIREFVMSTGVIPDVLSHLGFQKTNLLDKPHLFVPIYVISGIWQEVGWESIIYLAALVSIDPELYEAASIDGAGRWKQLWSVTLPGIVPTIMILLVLRIGRLLSVGYEKIILLYNPAIYETADVISSFVYRKGLQEFNWSYSAAVGMFNSAINLCLLVLANRFSRKISESSLW